MSLQLLRSLGQICLAYDVVAVEDAARLVAAETHGYTLRDTSTDHVADGGPPKIMDNNPIKTGCLACCLPCFAKISYGLAIQVKDNGTIWPPHLISFLDYSKKLTLERQDPSV